LVPLLSQVQILPNEVAFNGHTNVFSKLTHAGRTFEVPLPE